MFVSLLVNQFWGYSITTSSALQTSFMLIFFASIGLSANFTKLRQGEIGLIIFLIAISTFIVLLSHRRSAIKPCNIARY